MMWPGWGMGGWTMAFVGLMCLAVWGLLIAAVVAIVSRSRNVGLPRENPSSLPASEVLAARYARGEIDEDEYRHRLAVLEQSTVSPTRR